VYPSAHTRDIVETNTDKKLSYRLENRASASCFRLIITLYSREFGLFEFSYTLLVGFLANVHSNGCTTISPTVIRRIFSM